MANIDLNDSTPVVVIGSGAGGGTLANELCQKGVKVVLLEAGKRESPESFQNNEWGSFGQVSWLDKRTTSGTWWVSKGSQVRILPLRPIQSRSYTTLGGLRLTWGIPKGAKL